MKKIDRFLFMLHYSNPTWKDLDDLYKVLRGITKEEINSIFHYNDYLNFMKFRTLFITGVESRDFDKVKEAYDFYAEYLYPIVKERYSGDFNIRELRSKLGFTTV